MRSSSSWMNGNGLEQPGISLPPMSSGIGFSSSVGASRIRRTARSSYPSDARSGVRAPRGSATITPAVARASAGAIEHVPVAVVPNLARYLAEVKSGDLWIYAAAGDAEVSMWDTDLSGGLAFVFGAEGKGLRPLVRRTCDDAVSIPLLGRVESLNVSVAAALLLYEARRQRGG